MCLCYHSEEWFPRRWRRHTGLPASKTCRASSGVLLVCPSAGTRWSRCTLSGWSRRCWGRNHRSQSSKKNEKQETCLILSIILRIIHFDIWPLTCQMCCVWSSFCYVLSFICCPVMPPFSLKVTHFLSMCDSHCVIVWLIPIVSTCVLLSCVFSLCVRLVSSWIVVSGVPAYSCPVFSLLAFFLICLFIYFLQTLTFKPFWILTWVCESCILVVILVLSRTQV